MQNWKEPETSMIYLANGEQASAAVNGVSPQDGSGYVLVHGRNIKVGRLAAPYEFLGHGEVVTIHLQSGKTFVAVLQPQEYEHHVANIDIGEGDLALIRAHNPGDVITSGESTMITAVYEQETGQWREMTNEEYEKERRAWSEDMKDMESIKREWREYREG
jgi:beta-lactamase superfamily II metal-dependent hydrolase